MKKILPLLLVLSLLLCGCGKSDNTATTEPASPVLSGGMLSLEDGTYAQCFALMATHCFSGRELSGMDTETLWDATGWYAALLNRSQETSILSESTVDTFQRSLGGSFDYLDEEQTELLGVQSYKNEAGENYYSFVNHRMRLDELMGICYEFLTEERDGGILAVLRYHDRNGGSYDSTGLFAFSAGEASSAFPYTLGEVRELDPAVYCDEALSFDYELLCSCNGMAQLLELYAGVCVTTNDSYVDWYTLVQEKPFRATVYGDGSCYGCYDGLWFSTVEGRIRVTERSTEPWENMENALSYLLSDAAVLTLNEMGSDTIAFHVQFRDGHEGDFVCDRGTLALRSAEMIWDLAGEYRSSYRMSYGLSLPVQPGLEALNGNFKTVTIVEELEGSAQEQYTTSVLRLPADWEYLPYDADGDDFDTYTVWMNSDYTQPYVYPGDGVDYTLYFSTAKG